MPTKYRRTFLALGFFMVIASTLTYGQAVIWWWSWRALGFAVALVMLAVSLGVAVMFFLLATWEDPPMPTATNG